jgi:hypothetical protein
MDARCRFGNADTAGEGASKTREIKSSAVLHERWRKVLRSRLAGAGFKPPSAALVKSQGGERDGKGVTRSRHVSIKETNASEPSMKCRNSKGEIKTEGIRYFGKNLGETCLLPRWSPA